MRHLGALSLLALASCTGAAGWDAPIAAGTIASLESGHALLRDIQTVGVGDSAAMNAASRVRVRAVVCNPPERDRVICTYDSDRCLESEDPDGNGWCQRMATFVRWLAPPDPAFSKNGWFLERPD